MVGKILAAICKLHGKGSLDLHADASARMQEIRDISSGYDIRNIYNMEETGLFYRMRTRMTYLTREKIVQLREERRCRSTKAVSALLCA